MAWEMQRHMYSQVASSLFYAALKEDDTLDREKLEGWYIEQRLDMNNLDVDSQVRALKDDLKYHSNDALIHEIAEVAIETATTTNGAWEFYLDSSLHTSVPWCSEDQHLTYYS